MSEQQPELLPHKSTPLSPAEQARRAAYRQRLADYLKDPHFRAIEGFPSGTDEAILALSDPPYYTACPNPFLPEILVEWQQERSEIRANLGLVDDGYQREPFAADVSEGKNDPIYNAHSYHTKVPHKAIMRYILHYTDPGDIIFDGFCGTGMTGVAAQLCGDKKTVEELGYFVDEDGWIYEKSTENHPFSLWEKGRDEGNNLPQIQQLSHRDEGIIKVKPPLPPEILQRCRELRQKATDAEGLLWMLLRNRQLEGAKFRRQHPLIGYILDFYCHDARLAIEVDGSGHNENDQRRYDEERTSQLEAAGVHVLRFWNHEVLNNTQAVLEEIYAVVMSRMDANTSDFIATTTLTPALSQREREKDVVERRRPISRLGARKAVLNDLSPAATFIAYNYNTPVDAAAFEKEARRILQEVEHECGWMYETWHVPPTPEKHISPSELPSTSGRGAGGEGNWGENTEGIKGKINYTVWSDVFICPTCGQEMIFWDVAVDHKAGTIRDAWNCPGCAVLLAKSSKKESGALKAERAWESRFDRELKQIIRHANQVPVLINYSVGKQRFEKKPDTYDFELIQNIENSEIPYNVPTYPMMFKGEKWGDTWRSGIHLGITHVHHFYTRRNLWVLAAFWSKLDRKQKWLATMFLSRNLTKANRFVINEHNPKGRINGPLTGTWYIPSEQVEQSAIILFQEKILGVGWQINNNLISTESTSTISIKNNIMDYIFVDPPFGANFMYSELNFLWEAWLQVITNNKPEAIQNSTQEKDLAKYQALMTECFRKFYETLKPGRWMTVEFHNSHNVVWNALQEALQRAGFVVADVRTLDKVHAGIKAAYIVNLAKQDLIISAYKPNGKLEERFKLIAGTEDGVWEFVRYHLGKLPVTNQLDGKAIINAERQAYLLFDRMVAFHVQRGVMVPLSSPAFYAGLEQRFTRRDGMFFLPEQVAEYDRALLDSGKPTQIPMLVTDEKTAIIWLRLQLDPASNGEPQTRGDLTNLFNQTMHRAKHETALELVEILEQNFLQDPNGKWYVPDHNRASDLEKVRQRSLLKEFNEYAASTGRLRQFRSEAVRVGFTECFKRQDYGTIITVAERLPEDVLREDPDLLMYYDSALLRRTNK